MPPCRRLVKEAAGSHVPRCLARGHWTARPRDLRSFFASTGPWCALLFRGPVTFGGFERYLYIGGPSRGRAHPMPDAAEFFHRYHLAVYRYFLRLTGQADLAEGLTQDVFVRIVRSAGRYTAHHAGSRGCSRQPKKRHRHSATTLGANVLSRCCRGTRMCCGQIGPRQCRGFAMGDSPAG